MSAPKFKLRRMKIDRLTPAPYNPRRELKPGSRAYRKLAASLREFGLVEPLVWNEASGYVVGGHARLRILREMGVDEVPVSVVNLSPGREKALNIVLNNREAQSRFEPRLLADLLGELQELPELGLTGFDLEDLPALKLEPLPDLSPLEETGAVEVTLCTTRDIFERFSDRLDALVREFDLTCHVKGG